MIKFIHFYLFIFFYICFNLCIAQSNDNQSIKKTDIKNNTLQTHQPVIIIDASKLISTPKNNHPSTNSVALQPHSTPLSNNLRISSSGQYIDNTKTEQINSKGQICITESGKKTCN